MRYIDLRSDTVTTPTEEMKQAMISCEVGDDVYEDDPTINALEALAAKTLGKEAALFVPSGTMGNQLAIMTHTRRGDELLTNATNHIVLHEVGAAAVLSGVCYSLITNENGFIYPEDVEKGIRDPEDIHYPYTTLVCVENALGNGRVVPMEIMKGVYEAAKSRGVNVHMDGARIFNAAIALGVSAADLAGCADSVQFCVSKGLCAPVGSLLCGTKEFIKRARKNRKLLGGGMRQAGILAACGIVAIEKMTGRLAVDHENAKYLAKRLQELEYVEVDPSTVEINMVFFKINAKDFDHDGFVKHMLDASVKINPVEMGEYRYVTHNYVSKEDIDRVVDIMRAFR